MILVIKNADFSANCIERVELNRNLNPFTLAAIEASGNKSMTSEQKSALDTFFNKIGAFGNESEIWSKLDKVYIPFLCSDLTKACVNYKTNESEHELSAERYTLRNKGVAGVVEDPATYTENAISSSFVMDPKNMTIVSMLMEDDKSLSNIVPLFQYNGNSNTNRFHTTISKTGGGDFQGNIGFLKPSGSFPYAVYNSYPVKHALVGFTIRSVNDQCLLKVDRVTDTTTDLSFLSSVGTDTSSNINIFATATSAAMQKMAPSLGLMIVGKSLTTEEAITLKSASETLVEFFK